LRSIANRVNGKYKSVKKIVVTTLCVLAILWVGCCIAIYNAMQQPPERFGRFMSKIPGPVAFLVFPFETMWKQARAGTLAIGDAAPDFTLTKLDKSAQVQLSSFTAQGKPVVLVFGSYT
jgi:AhpC/TSA family